MSTVHNTSNFSLDTCEALLKNGDVLCLYSEGSQKSELIFHKCLPKDDSKSFTSSTTKPSFYFIQVSKEKASEIIYKSFWPAYLKMVKFTECHCSLKSRTLQQINGTPRDMVDPHPAHYFHAG